ncbi:MAG: segregation/condensation protein A, partial [Dehalococcoidia bacterium]|nr:segregation/condensation protein A [Dehalococcoidia bacterium]
LKARSLLPQAAAPEDEEVPISLEELQRRLKEYEQFKTVAQLLSELHALQHQHFTREPGEALEGIEVETPEGEVVGFDVEVTDLMSAFAQVLKRATSPVYEVTSEPWTVEMKVLELRTLLAVRRQVRFFDLFSPAQSKLELVVTFLAMLELMRQRAARAVQESHFGEIFVTVYERRIKPREESHGTG